MLPVPPPPDVASTLPQTEAERQRARELSREEDQPPAEVPGFRVQKKIGEGRFGSVWLAREQNTGKQVAIKFYAQRRGVDWSLLGREVEKLAVLYTSRNIVGLLHVGWDHDPPYYVMEYLSRGSLADRLASGPLPVPEAVRIATRLSQALVHAHGSGILHCDLKPANVLLDQDGEPRLCDFGQSRLADERSGALGTLFYMAPEQADLKAIPDARWDVYGLGALLYHMVTGAPPFRTPEADAKLQASANLEEQLSVYRQIVITSPRPALHRHAPGIDAPLVDIIDRCLAVSPARRFSNAQAVLDRLIDRERQRSRRPLLLLGLVLPLLLGMFISPLALQAIYDAISTARSNLTARALESDVLSVNLLANNLKRELEDRHEDLQRIADEPELRSLIAKFATLPREERAPLMEQLDAIREANRIRRRELGRLPDNSWFLQDALGVQRWREPDSMSVDRNYSYRDYFNGLEEDYSEENHPPGLQPIRNKRISRPYQSTSTDEFTVSLTVPVWDADRQNVIGVLGRSIRLSELLADYEHLLSDDAHGVGRVLALIDSRQWRLIAHSGWKAETTRRSMKPDDFAKLNVPDELAARLKSRLSDHAAEPEFDRTARYLDPMSEIRPDEFGELWLAAFAPVGDTGWIAVVQERRAAAFEAVDELRTRLVLFGVTAVVIVVVLVAGCWWLIVRIVNNRPLTFWRPGSALGNLPTAGTLAGTTKGNDRG